MHPVKSAPRTRSARPWLYAAVLSSTMLLGCEPIASEEARETERTAQASAPLTPIVQATSKRFFANRANTCAVDEVGSLFCWGNNAYGTLGVAPSLLAMSPTPLPIALVGATDVAVAEAMCAVAGGTGQVYCWGTSFYGNQGNRAPSEPYVPKPLPGLSLAQRVIGGEAHMCAIAGTDRQVSCWGANTNRQLGVDSSVTGTSTSTPQTVSGLNQVHDLAAGFIHTCAVTAAGQVKCWGGNADGQLGRGTVLASGGAAVGLVETAAGVPLTGVVEVEAAANTTCALTTAGTVYCWGQNESGQVGNGVASTTDVLRATQVSGLTGAVGLTVGGSHSCAVLADGGARCWGANGTGQLGTGATSAAQPLPQTVMSAVGALSAISAGDGYTCGLRVDGTLLCWGDNSDNTLGDGTTVAYRTAPTPVVGLKRTGPGVKVSTGYETTCGLLANGTVKCWGANSFGQLGDGTTAFASPSAPPVDFGGLKARDVASGRSFSCAVLENGTARCWGSNTYGQLGNAGAASTAGVPVTVSGLGNLKSIALGHYTAFALSADGRVSSWGLNDFGQLGIGTTTNANVPQLITFPSGNPRIRKVSARADHACALTEGAQVYCWGRNYGGPLGNNTLTDSSTPVLVQVAGGASLTGMVDISTAHNHTCALRQDATVWCWGNNGYGQFGDPSVGWESLYAVQVPGLSGVAEVLGAFMHTCARRSNGQVLCTGDNTYGALGLGTSGNTVYAFTAIPFAFPAPVLQMDGDRDRTCAALGDGTVSCWGLNAKYQSGEVAAAAQPTPTLVSTFQAPLSATHDASLGAPRCQGDVVGCDSGSLLTGRGSMAMGAEPHAPNTLGGTCADGTSGTFHLDESLDRLEVFSPTGGLLTAGQSARVRASVWAYSSGDFLDLYVATNVAAPAWTLLTSMTVPGGAQVLTYDFTLPTGSTRLAVRGVLRYGGSAAACTPGSFNDHDDLVFDVKP